MKPKFLPQSAALASQNLIIKKSLPSAALASQNLNIFMGCGMPWFLACLCNADKGIYIRVDAPDLALPLDWIIWMTLLLRVFFCGRSGLTETNQNQILQS